MQKILGLELVFLLLTFDCWNCRLLFLASAESRVPSTPSSLQLHPQANSVVVSWTPPSDQSVLIRGYILGYGIGIPDVYRQILDAKQRYHTIKGLSKFVTCATSSIGMYLVVNWKMFCYLLSSVIQPSLLSPECWRASFYLASVLFWYRFLF